MLEVLNICGEWKTPRRAAKVCLLKRSMDKAGMIFFFSGEVKRPLNEAGDACSRLRSLWWK